METSSLPTSLSLTVSSPWSASPSLSLGHCDQFRPTGHRFCSCYKASFEQLCQSCSRQITAGHCATKNKAIGGWMHIKCPYETARGLPVIQQRLNQVDLRRLKNTSEQPTAESVVRRMLKADSADDPSQKEENVTNKEADDSNLKQETDDKEVPQEQEAKEIKQEGEEINSAGEGESKYTSTVTTFNDPNKTEEKPHPAKRQQCSEPGASRNDNQAAVTSVTPDRTRSSVNRQHLCKDDKDENSDATEYKDNQNVVCPDKTPSSMDRHHGDNDEDDDDDDQGDNDGTEYKDEDEGHHAKILTPDKAVSTSLDPGISPKNQSIRRKLSFGVENLDSISPPVHASKKRRLFDEESKATEDDPNGSNIEVPLTHEEKYGSDSEEKGRKGLTSEQAEIINHEPSKGEVVGVNALAGCGKTTTIALLCNKAVNNGALVLYVVFNKKNELEAKQSFKFPKHNMEIRTTHSFVLRHYFSSNYMSKVKPCASIPRENIIETLQLEEDPTIVKIKAVVNNDKKMKKIVKTIAGTILKTLHNFQVSSEQTILPDHIPWRDRRNNARKSLRSKRKKWKESIEEIKYIKWATTFFNVVHEQCRHIRDSGEESKFKISHDAYLKVAQLEGLHIPFDVVAIDEAQDMTPCQADLFWGTRQRHDKVTYLFGDHWQQLYRFRGVRGDFRAIVSSSDKIGVSCFSLTGSFRFGPNIAAFGSYILEKMGSSDRLRGLASADGAVYDYDDFICGVVLCRTNVGMDKFLMCRNPVRWCYLDKSRKVVSLKFPKWVYELEEFVWWVKGNLGKFEASHQNDHWMGLDHQSVRPEPKSATDSESSFEYDGEVFGTIEEIHEYIEEEDDTELWHKLELVLLLRQQKKTLDEFMNDIKQSFAPLGENENVDDYQGVVLSTTHKAKGLEFENVLIWDDYTFEMLQEQSFLSIQRITDEAHQLYVAITRAKANLFLPCATKDFFSKKAEAFGGSGLSLTEWDSKWEEFEQADGPINALDDIPWPTNGITSVNSFRLDSTIGDDEQKSFLRKMIRRFHTDKFLPKMKERLANISKTELTEVISKLNSYLEIAQRTQASLRSLELANASENNN
ncbi:hypothetical protein ACA910_018817 [Epithemia clementina (nom. ined.)]